jgi:hypothetical protein
LPAKSSVSCNAAPQCGHLKLMNMPKIPFMTQWSRFGNAHASHAATTLLGGYEIFRKRHANQSGARRKVNARLMLREWAIFPRATFRACHLGDPERCAQMVRCVRILVRSGQRDYGAGQTILLLIETVDDDCSH